LRRKSVIVGTILFVLLVGGVLLSVFLLVRHEPESYVLTYVAPGPERLQASKKFERKAVDLSSQIANYFDWKVEFTEEEVNSYLAEDFLRLRPIDMPNDVSEPRIAFRDGKFCVAFRYGNGVASSVVSLEARVWVSQYEPNVLLIQIEELRAGALPLTTKFLQQHLRESADGLNIDLQWYRNEGYPVVLLRFQSNRREPTIRFDELQLHSGKLYVKGRSLDPDLRRAAGDAGESPIGRE
jgi:hypothetical protein